MKLNKIKSLRYLAAAGAVLLIAAFVLIFKDNLQSIRDTYASPGGVKSFILSYGSWSAAVFILIYSLRPILMIIPASIFSIMAGNVFGPYYGLLLSMTGCFLSATLAFILADKLGKSFVDRHLKGKAMELDSKIGKHGFKIMLLMRLSVIFPYDALSYAAGLSKMRYRHFIAGTVLGILPEMACYSFIGKSFEGQFQIIYLLPVAVVAIIAFAASRYYKTVKND